MAVIHLPAIQASVSCDLKNEHIMTESGLRFLQTKSVEICKHFVTLIMIGTSDVERDLARRS